MNKIKVVNDNLQQANVSKYIEVEYYRKECLFAINDLKINVTKDSDLDIELDLKEDSKLNFNININSNVKLNLNINTIGKTGKIQYKYSLNENSICNVNKFQNINGIKEMIIVNLNGINADFEYNFKTISNNKETYDYHIFHNFNNTISNIKNNGVCINDGNIIYQVSSFVPKEIVGCIVNQNNRIINLTDNKCEIKPNLYIDSYDVEASHSALIGKFSDEEMFYIRSRGIDYNNALKLLITGFLTSDINNKKIINNISKNINKYWR
jgi:Fe-S cluster assembly protein SufD